MNTPEPGKLINAVIEKGLMAKKLPLYDLVDGPKKDPLAELEKSLEKKDDSKNAGKSAPKELPNVGKEKLSETARQSVIDQIRQIAFSRSRTKQDEIRRLITSSGATGDPAISEVLGRYALFLRNIEDSEAAPKKAHYCSSHHKFDYCEGAGGGGGSAQPFVSYSSGSFSYSASSGAAYSGGPAKGSNPYSH